jgi:hypothetical protein
MDLKSFIGTTVRHDGDDWEVRGVGVEVDGKVFCHLASTRRGTMQKNGWVARQINDFINIKEITGE